MNKDGTMASNVESDPDYTRQVITIKKDVYQFIRDIAWADKSRKIKIGDVIQRYIALAHQFADIELINKEMQSLRDAKYPITKKEVSDALASMSTEEQMKLIELAKQAKEASG